MKKLLLVVFPLLLILAVILFQNNLAVRDGDPSRLSLANRSQETQEIDLGVENPPELIRFVVEEKRRQSPQACSVEVIWRGDLPLNGYLSRHDGNKSVALEFTHPGAKGGRLQVPLSPGTYSIHFEDGVVGKPSQFFVGSGRISVAAVPEIVSTLKILRFGKPVVNAEILVQEEGWRKKWIGKGMTDGKGELVIFSPAQIEKLVVLKAGQFLARVQPEKIFEINSSKPEVNLSLSALEESQIEIVERIFQKSIPRAVLMLGGKSVGEGQDGGKIRLSLLGNPLKWCRIEAVGFVASNIFTPAGENSFRVLLDSFDGLRIQALRSEGGSPVGGAHVLVFEEGKTPFPKLLQESVTTKSGEFGLPNRFSKKGAVVVWSAHDGYSATTVGALREEGQIILEQQPPLVIGVDGIQARGHEVMLSTCTAISMWGESLKVNQMKNGDFLIGGALGAQLIDIKQSSGGSFQLRRADSFSGKASLIKLGVREAMQGRIAPKSSRQYDVAGRVSFAEHYSNYILEISLKLQRSREETRRKWPRMGGRVPSNLSGWVWADLNARYKTVANSTGEFVLRGVQEGSYEVLITNLSKSKRPMHLLDSSEVHVPTVGFLELNIQDEINLAWTILNREGIPVTGKTMLEYSSRGYFGPDSSRFLEFSNNKIIASLGLYEAERIRVLAPGYEPLEILPRIDAEGMDRRKIMLSAVASMHISFQDERLSGKGRTLVVEALYPQESSTMETLGYSEIGINEKEYFGPFPGCEIFLSGGEGFEGTITPSRFLYEPGAAIEIRLRDR